MLIHVCLLTLLVILQTYTCVPLQEEKIETVNLSYYCMHAETGEEKHNKSIILLIHGLSSSSQDWDGVSEVLAIRTGRRVCAVDLRNHGNSPWNDRFDIPALTADVAEFLDSNKIEKVNLIGHSLGGKVSVHYALTNPNRVNSLVVEDMRPNTAAPEALAFVKAAINFLKEAIEKVPNGSNEDEARKIIVDFFRQKLKEAGIDEEIDEKTAKSLSIKCPDGKCQYKFNLDVIAKAFETPDTLLIESKGLYEGPALFIYGKKSPFDVAADKENILKLFPKAQLVGVEGAGHLVHGGHRQFDDEVIRFLHPLN